MPPKPTPTAAAAHEDLSIECHVLAAKVADALPVPSGGATWADVGDLNSIKTKLTDVLAILKGEER